MAIPESQTEQLIAQAMNVRKNAHAPYSDFPVGAAVMTKDGDTFVGCNVENASYGLAICAERNAICAAVAAGQSEIVCVVIAASGLASPCGACRQFIFEFGETIEVITINADDPREKKSWKISDLLIDGFSSDNLE